MLNDLLAVMFVEKKLLFRGKFFTGYVFRLLIPLVIIVALAIRIAYLQTASWVPLAYWIWITSTLASQPVVFLFARDREHHTLERMLSSPLSEKAIVVGKISTTVLYGTGVSIVALLVLMGMGLILAVHDKFSMYASEVGILVVVIVLPSALFGASSSFAITLLFRSAEIAVVVGRFSILIPFLVVFSILLFGWFPSTTVNFGDMSAFTLLYAVGAILLVCAGVSVAIALNQFKRNRLMS